MAHVVEAGGQAALMAPTELLARQHFSTIAPLAEAAGIEAVLLTGKDRARGARRMRWSGSPPGEPQIAIGTHALFQAGVEFSQLGLAVVDEQHRFGVHQRLALSSKGEAPDTLVMTATPIPRTLVLSYFGDMEVSRLTEKPAGRQPIDTRAVSLDRLDEVVARIGRAIEAGDKAYWVCPLVEESEKIDRRRPRTASPRCNKVFGRRVGLIHGRMSAAEKDAVMERFRAGDIAILVSTTVIEVGVDVPDATIMVIEHAERFGLAQLHQLRGRVGRGRQRSVCLLLYRGAARRDGEGAARRHARDGGRLSHRRGGSEAARRRRPARHAPIRHAGFSRRAAGRAWRAAAARPRRGEARLVARSGFRLRARRGASPAPLSFRARRSRAAHAGGVIRRVREARAPLAQHARPRVAARSRSICRLNGRMNGSELRPSRGIGADAAAIDRGNRQREIEHGREVWLAQVFELVEV